MHAFVPEKKTKGRPLPTHLLGHLLVDRLAAAAALRREGDHQHRALPREHPRLERLAPRQRGKGLAGLLPVVVPDGRRAQKGQRRLLGLRGDGRVRPVQGAELVGGDGGAVPVVDEEHAVAPVVGQLLLDARAVPYFLCGLGG